MSRIFEALQRSESQRAGGAFADQPGIATELLEAAERETPATPAAPVFDSAPTSLDHFKSLPALVVPETRLVSMTSKDSLAAEKFRFLGVRLRRLQQERGIKKILITGTLPEEGKSLVAANLAATLAHRQQKVLLLEGDLRRPVLAQQVGHPHVRGITEWLHAANEPISNIYYLDGLGFWLLPAGRPPENPLELMQTGKLSVLFEQLTAAFDWIIIDSPPLLPLADTSVWARLADGVLLVVREGKTEKRQLQRALTALDRETFLGVVVNNCSSTDNRNYYTRYSPGAAGPQGPPE